jgi:hypothetical protein
MKTWITRRPLLWASLALAVLPVLAISASASTGTPARASTGILARAAIPAVTGTFRDGPYAATTPDSGSCGNNWAIDLFSRQFVIHPQNLDGTWTVVENFKNGRFITLGDGATGRAASPGQCDPDNGSNTHMLRPGVVGTFSGSFTITIDSGFLYTANKGCNSAEGASGASTDDGCTTKGWVDLAFPGFSYSSANVTAYSLTYKANSQTWVDANTGDTGDIFTSLS